MLCALSSVVWSCAARRARLVLVQNPLLGLLGCVLVAAAPVGAALAGLRLASTFAAASSYDAFAASLALGLATTGAIVGLTVALAAPGLRALGPQLAGAPLSPLTAALGLTVVPVLVAGAAASVPLLLFGVGLAGARGAVLVAARAASALVGAALAEAGRLLAGGSAAGLAVAGSAALVVVGSPLAWQAPPEAGPAAAVVPLLGGGSVARTGAGLLATAAAACALWTAACAIPRAHRAHARELRRDRTLPRGAGLAVALACARVVVRHPELRLPALATVAVPVGVAALLALALGTGGEPLVAFVAGLALTAAAIFPSASQGVARDARWLLAAAPQRASSTSGAAAAGGVLVALALVATAVLAAAPLARADAGTYLAFQGVAAFVAGSAAAAGALVPWRPGELAQQLASYGTVLVLALVLWVAVGQLGQLVGEPSGPLFSLAVGNAVLLAGVGAAAVAAR